MKTPNNTPKGNRKLKADERPPVSKRVLKNAFQDEDSNTALRDWKRGY